MNIAVIFGGKSCEHNISVITGVQALKNVSEKHKAIAVYIDENGRWFTGSGLYDIGLFKKENAQKLGKKLKRAHFIPASSYLYNEKGKKLHKIDAALICLHGLNGEDGTVQGVLQLADIAFTGPGVLSAAVSMDKITMKKLFTSCGLPVLPYEYFDAEEYNGDLFSIVERIKKNLTFPLIVKPSNLGSSIGIGIAKDFKQFFECVSAALKWDTRVIVENALKDFKELNCAVIGSGTDLAASEVEEPVGYKEFLTYEDKYVKKTKGSGRNFPADIEPDTREAVRSFAKKAFAAVGASGIARTDFLLKDGNLYVNEINTVPGSLSNYLFPFEYCDLIDRLVDIALNEKDKRDKICYSYKSPFEINAGKK